MREPPPRPMRTARGVPLDELSRRWDGGFSSSQPQSPGDRLK